jgi:hypothetical protein
MANLRDSTVVSKGAFDSPAKSRNCSRRSGTSSSRVGMDECIIQLNHKGNVKRPQGTFRVFHSMRPRSSTWWRTWNRKLDIEKCKFNNREVRHLSSPLLKGQRGHPGGSREGCCNSILTDPEIRRRRIGVAGFDGFYRRFVSRSSGPLKNALTANTFSPNQGNGE